MRGVKIHGALLLVAIVLTFATWLPARRNADVEPFVPVWSRDSMDVLSVSYRSEIHDVAVTRRAENGESYLWGREVGHRPQAAPEDYDTLSFPVGIAGSELMGAFADFNVVRDLGVLPSPQTGDFGLDEPSARVTVSFSDEVRVLEIGDSVYGASDRFARDSATGRVFVLPARVITPLAHGSEALRERQVHHFPDTDVARVVVRVDGRERTMLRSGDGGAGGRWASPTTPGSADRAFADFMERVGQLGISGFQDRVEAESLDRLLRIDYFDRGDEVLGYLELFEDPRKGAYYLWSERTRIGASVLSLLGDRVAQDLVGLY